MAYISFQPNDYFNTKLYTGTGSSNTVSVGFEPSLTWIKNRGDAESHCLFDAVRTNGYYLKSDATSAEIDGASAGLWSAFTSDGFTVLNGNRTNDSSDTYCSWNWRANGAGVSNTDGSITSTVSASTTSGFSIIKYTGTGSNASIGTGLGAIPHMAIFKRTDTAGFNWFVYHRSLGAGKFIILDSTGAEQSSTSIWQNTTPTSSVITLGGDGGVNASGGTYICYAFTEKKAFSAMGSYVGNGNADGSFIYTNGMKPAFVMIKNSSATESWYILDTKRPSYNTNNYYLLPNTSGAEGTSTSLATSLLSNGFKIENSDTSMNTSGQTYIYMAFAEEPLVSSNGVPATAR